LHTVEDFGAWLQRTGQSWRALFPYLDTEERVWQALAELDAAGQKILFHGHTHQQSIWHWHPGGGLRQLHGDSVAVEVGHRYIVGVGSVGLPEDGGWATYALFDAARPGDSRGGTKHDVGRIELIRVDGERA
jgi:diadenosine tetraphosphatase ApaH/serine/threonine PP2A family protein phosphatase